MAQEHHFQLVATWTGADRGSTESYESYSREYLIEIEGKPDLIGSSAPSFRGDASLHNPEDLLLAALAGCHMLSFLAIAAHAKVAVIDYVDDATATMAIKDGRMRFVETTLRPRVVVPKGTDLAQIEEFHHKANQGCFIANSVNFPVNHIAETVEG